MSESSRANLKEMVFKQVHYLTQADAGNDMNRDVSESSRASLKETVFKQSHSLTHAEQEFLYKLCVVGNEIEVQFAHERLLDSDLFFNPNDSGRGWPSDKICMGNERDDDSISALKETNGESERNPSLSINPMDYSIRTLGSLGMGSEQRQAVLEARRHSSFMNLWKAHENGLAISKQASRRSVMVRRASYSTRDLYDPDIFRPSTLEGVKSDNKWRVSEASGPKVARMPLNGKQVGPKARPALRRMESEGSRKSVTFSAHMPKPLRDPISTRSTSLPGRQELERASSGGSIPSIHHGVPVTSPTSSQSLVSIPSLHSAHPIRSNSVVSDYDASVHSDITESERFGDFPSDEKKSNWEFPFASSRDVIPGKYQPIPLQDATKLLQENDPDAPQQLFLDVLSNKNKAFTRPVIMRRASRSIDQGEGIEVTEISIDGREVFEAVPSLGDAITMKRSNSFDETMSSLRAGSIFRRHFRRSLSDDSLGNHFGRSLLLDNSSRARQIVPIEDDDSSWNDGFDDEDYYDSWKVIEDEYMNGYGGGGTLPFRILGTSADDINAHPHVLSPPLMESLQAFLPPSKCADNFWMKYSMVRDGASFHSFLQLARGAKYSILAIETVDGEVFGAFTAEPWRKNWNFFGNGESFLFKMRMSRKEKCHSIIDQAHMESEIDVYPFTGFNHSIQLCTHDKIAVGGGTFESPSSSKEFNASSSSQSGDDDEWNREFKDHEWGFGLTIESDFMHGTSSPCLTFGSPSLSTEHPNGSLFEIMNLELWTLTPCYRLEDAEKLELGKLFLEEHTN